MNNKKKMRSRIIEKIKSFKTNLFLNKFLEFRIDIRTCILHFILKMIVDDSRNRQNNRHNIIANA